MIIPKRLAHLKTMAISPLGFPKKCEKPVIPHYIFFPCTSKHALFPEKKITRYLLLYILIFFPFNSTLWKYVPTDVVGHTCRRTGQKTQTAAPPAARIFTYKPLHFRFPFRAILCRTQNVIKEVGVVCTHTSDR